MTSVRICLQWTLIVFNTFSIILGILGIVAGVFELQKCFDGTAECPEKIGQIVMCSVLVISAFIGCCGAVNGSIKTLSVFLVILLALIVAHGWKLWRHDVVQQKALVETMVTGIWISERARSGAMNEIQQKYECCGKYSYLDYKIGNGEISKSCYHPYTVLNNNPYPQGCLQAVNNAYLKFYRYEFMSHIGLICFEALGGLLTIILMFKLMAKTRRYHY